MPGMTSRKWVLGNDVHFGIVGLLSWRWILSSIFQETLATFISQARHFKENCVVKWPLNSLFFSFLLITLEGFACGCVVTPTPRLPWFPVVLQCSSTHYQKLLLQLFKTAHLCWLFSLMKSWFLFSSTQNWGCPKQQRQSPHWRQWRRFGMSRLG